MRHRIRLATALTGGLWLPLGAHAQVEPYIVFLIDTSASMTGEACDPSTAGDVDDTAECPGVDVACATCNSWGCDDGLANDSRLWKSKKIATDAINAHPDATYALARFHQDPVTFACNQGGWDGAAPSCLGAPLGMGDNSADILVEFAPGNETDLLEWMDFQDNYAGTPPATGCTLCAACGGGCDKELRPSGASAAAGSLTSVKQYVQSAMAADPDVGCRPYAVILFHDGNNCTDPDNPGDANPTPEQAAAICAIGAPVYAVSIEDATPPAYQNEVADAGCGPGCDQTGCDGNPILSGNENDLALAIDAIIQAQVDAVPVEMCNALDDDCDALTDEDFPGLGQPCGVGACAGGTGCCLSPSTEGCCGPPPSSEVCNCIDDDCNGLLDDGAGCACGDGCCSEGETPCGCPSDCVGTCGDGCCTSFEDCVACPTDCGACPEPGIEPGPDLGPEPMPDVAAEPPLDSALEAPRDGLGDLGSDAGSDVGSDLASDPPRDAPLGASEGVADGANVGQAQGGCSCTLARTAGGPFAWLTIGLVGAIRRRRRASRSAFLHE